MSAAAVLGRMVGALDRAAIRYMVVGTFASTWYGAPRTTQDVDIVIDPTAEELDRFLDDIRDDDLYVSPSARQALAERDQFVIDTTSGWKVDLVICKDRAFSRTELDRRQPARILDLDVFTASAEDTVLTKLERAAAGGGSERQLRDAATVIAVNGDRIDDGYLDRWAAELGITRLLADARRAATA